MFYAKLSYAILCYSVIFKSYSIPKHVLIYIFGYHPQVEGEGA